MAKKRTLHKFERINGDVIVTSQIDIARLSDRSISYIRRCVKALKDGEHLKEAEFTVSRQRARLAVTAMSDICPVVLMGARLPFSRWGEMFD